MQHCINSAKRVSPSKSSFIEFYQSLFISQYLELILTVVYADCVIDQASMWLESLRADSSRRSDGVVSMRRITASRANRSGAIVSFKESAIRAR